MFEISATHAAKRFSQCRQVAQREPVAVTHHSRITEVLISKRDYDEYVRLKSLATRTLKPAELSDETVQALIAATMDTRHDHLNALMDD